MLPVLQDSPQMTQRRILLIFESFMMVPLPLPKGSETDFNKITVPNSKITANAGKERVSKEIIDRETGPKQISASEHETGVCAFYELEPSDTNRVGYVIPLI